MPDVRWIIAMRHRLEHAQNFQERTMRTKIVNLALVAALAMLAERVEGGQR